MGAPKAVSRAASAAGFLVSCNRVAKQPGAYAPRLALVVALPFPPLGDGGAWAGFLMKRPWASRFGSVGCACRRLPLWPLVDGGGVTGDAVAGVCGASLPGTRTAAAGCA